MADFLDEDSIEAVSSFRASGGDLNVSVKTRRPVRFADLVKNDKLHRDISVEIDDQVSPFQTSITYSFVDLLVPNSITRTVFAPGNYSISNNLTSLFSRGSSSNAPSQKE